VQNIFIRYLKVGITNPNHNWAARPIKATEITMAVADLLLLYPRTMQQLKP